MRQAFTMIELVFVIVVIGILATIAIPKFSATRDDAIVTKASTTLASIRSALSQEIQRRQMVGDYTPVNNLGGTTNSYNSEIFNKFDGNGEMVLQYPPHSCKSGATNCWIRTGAKEYTFYFPASIGGSAKFKVDNNRFICADSDKTKCRILEN